MSESYDRKTENNHQLDSEPEVYAVRWEKGKAQVTRRDILKAGGVMMAGAVVAGCTPDEKPVIESGRPKATPGITATKKTIGPTRTLTPTGTSVPANELSDWNCENTRAHESEITRILMTPDGRSMISFSNKEDFVKLWSFPDGSQCEVLPAVGLVKSVAVSPDSQLLYCLDDSGSVQVWSIPDAEVINELIVDRNMGTYPMIYLSLDGKFLVVRGQDGQFSLWSVPDCQFMDEWQHPDATTLYFEYSPNSRYLVSVAYIEQSVSVWSLEDRKLIQTLPSNASFILPKFSKNSQFIAFPNETAIDIYALSDGAIVRTLKGHQSEIVDLAFCQATNQLISADMDGMIMVWSFDQDEAQTFWEVENSTYMQVNEAAQILININYADQKVSFFSLPKGELVKEIKIFKSYANVGSSEYGPFLYVLMTESAHEEDVLEIYGLETISLLNEVVQTGYHVLTFSPDNRFLVTGNEDGVVRLYSLETGQQVSCMVDLSVSGGEVEGIKYEVEVEGQTVTYTLPCGSAIPPGAVCVCNCVSGSGCACVGHSTCSCVGHSTCSCVGHSTCSCVADFCSCVSHSSGCSVVYHYWYPD